MMDRKILRKRVLAGRDAIPEQERKKRSAAITEKVLQLKEFQAAQTIFAYVSFRSEVSTEQLIIQSLSLGKRIAVPLTITENFLLKPYLISDPEKDLSPGYCDIPEPDPTRLQSVSPVDIDLIILPGSVFDPCGGRLGYGGGYYDRFISLQAPQALRVGVAFEEQVVSVVPVEEHDQPVHILVTEERVISTFPFNTE
jgi:5-formyltetrahydrofolate cyclo-ligase